MFINTNVTMSEKQENRKPVKRKTNNVMKIKK